jgi:hypothetical protein
LARRKGETILDVATSTQSLAALVPPAPLAALTALAVDKLAATYPPSVKARADDIFALARLFAVSLKTGTASDQAQRWHHLLMAAGNFKRQAGSIRVGPLIQASNVPPPPPFVPPGAEAGSVPLAPRSGHEYFVTVKGLRRIPTASVVLAALWPDDNLIADRRDLNAAIGLLLHTVPSRQAAVDDLRAWSRHRRRVGIVTSDFDWLRNVATATLAQPGFVGVSMLSFERALFMLDKRTPQIAWPEYSIELARQAELCPGCQVLRRSRHVLGCAQAEGDDLALW